MVTLRKVVRSAVPLVAFLGLVTACGDDKSDDAKKGTESCTGGACAAGTGFVQDVAGGKAVLDFSDADLGAQYVLMPFVLGDINTVVGAGETTFKFSISSAAGGSAGLQELDLAPKAAAPEAAATSLDHQRRTLANRFDPTLADQTAEYWSLVRKYDAETTRGSFLAGTGLRRPDSLEAQLRAASRRSRASAQLTTTATGGCPEKEVMIPGQSPTAEAEPVDITMPVVDGGDYCIVYLDAPVTESDKTAIESTVKTVIKTYKDAVYQDQFAPANGFTFKPVIVVTAFDSDLHWVKYNAANEWSKLLNVAGVYLSSMSKQAKMPMLYMASDFSKLQTPPGGSDAALAKKLWHSTVAHELQHAVLNYYRAYAKGVQADETAAVDEGIAHFMEDAWGYGAENFGGFAGKFIGNFAFGNSPFLIAQLVKDKDDDAMMRGGGQSLMYYLASQKGGVTFTSGRMSGGAGLEYVVSVVKNGATQGAKTLSAKYNGAWTEAIGKFLGALVLDGSNVKDVVDSFKVAAPKAEVTDLNGTAGKTFGMRFNNFGSLKEVATDIQGKTTDTTSVEVRHYHTKPLLYTVTDAARKVTFTLTGSETNAAVTAVRIK